MKPEPSFSRKASGSRYFITLYFPVLSPAGPYHPPGVSLLLHPAQAGTAETQMISAKGAAPGDRMSIPHPTQKMNEDGVIIISRPRQINIKSRRKHYAHKGQMLIPIFRGRRRV